MTLCEEFLVARILIAAPLDSRGNTAYTGVLPSKQVISMLRGSSRWQEGARAERRDVATVMLASAQTANAPKSNWLADSVSRDGNALHMHGRVRIAACGIISASNAVGGPDADETVLIGNVRLKLTNGVDPLR
jgi:hypothetical protein